MITGKPTNKTGKNSYSQDRRDFGMSDNIAGQLIEAYNRGFADGYAIGTKEYADYEVDMEMMKADE